jgi:hypothetical protein
LIGIVLLTSIFSAPYQLSAAGFDGSEPLLCAVIKAVECDVERGCQEASVEDMNLPRFIKVDLDKNKISGKKEDGSKRETNIKVIEQVDNKLIMQGSEQGRGWSIVIGKDTGKMSATVSADEVGFVVFGACTTL